MLPTPVLVLVPLAAFAVAAVGGFVLDRVGPRRRAHPRPLKDQAEPAYFVAAGVLGFLLAVPYILDPFLPESRTMGRIVGTAVIDGGYDADLNKRPDSYAIDFWDDGVVTQIIVPHEVYERVVPGDEVVIARSAQVRRLRELTVVAGAHTGYYYRWSVLMDFLVTALVVILLPFGSLIVGAQGIIVVAVLQIIAGALWRRLHPAAPR